MGESHVTDRSRYPPRLRSVTERVGKSAKSGGWNIYGLGQRAELSIFHPYAIGVSLSRCCLCASLSTSTPEHGAPGCIYDAIQLFEMRKVHDGVFRGLLMVTVELSLAHLRLSPHVPSILEMVCTPSLVRKQGSGVAREGRNGNGDWVHCLCNSAALSPHEESNDSPDT